MEILIATLAFFTTMATSSKDIFVSTKNQYQEKQYDDFTRDRTILLPKTGKGKEKKLTTPVLKSRQPIRVYAITDVTGRVLIGNYNNQNALRQKLKE